MTRSCTALGLDLNGCNEILYKFFLSSRELVPEGIREVKRAPDHVVDKAHASEAVSAGDEHAAMVGRVRPGRVDTGLPVYQNVERVKIGSIRSLLAVHGFWLTDVHFYEKPAYNGKKPQYVIVLLLSQKGEALQLPRKTVEGLRRLARENIWRTNIFDNGPDKPATVNFTGRQQGTPAMVLAIRDVFLRAVDFEGGDSDETERLEEARCEGRILEALSEL